MATKPQTASSQEITNMHLCNTSSDTQIYESIDVTPNPSVKDHVIPGDQSMINSETYCEGNVDWKRCVLRIDLKRLNLFEDVTTEGREFQIFGPATENAFLAILVSVGFRI